MEAFFFGPAASPLYGCLDPAAAPPRRTGVVLCPSWGEEYQRFHRALRQLARRLAAAGFAALRFDYYGSGDSAGESGAGGGERWTADVAAAAAELRRRTGDGEVCLLGLRLGGLLALRAAAAVRPTHLVLWDPVPSGAAFLTELAAQHADMLRRAHVRPRPEGEGELLGFPLPAALRAELAGLRPPPRLDVPLRAALLVLTRPGADPAWAAARLRDRGAAVTRWEHPLPETWRWLEDFGKVLVPAAVLARIVDWLREAAP